MDSLSRHIRDTTGLTMHEFCLNYLDVNFPAFRSRIKKNGIPYPDEALLICLVTGHSPLELFGRQAIEVFLLNGKDSVRNRIKDILKDNPSEKINMILNDPSGLRIAVPDMKSIGKPRKTAEKKVKEKKVKPVIEEKSVEMKVSKAPEGDFDFVETNLFK